jgi:pimeloyl-ACP methyl ester carboxylesterase
MLSSAEVAAVKSTTGRLRPVPVPPWMRQSFRLTASVAPGVAAAWADRVFFTPRPARVRAEEAEALASAETFTVRVGKRNLQGWVWQGERSPVLLVHGWGGHTGQMTTLARSLVAAGHRVVGVDMPGHGASGGDRSSLVHFHRAIEATARLFGPFRGCVAHSFGCAGTTLSLARAVPIERVVFIAPPAGFQDFWDRFCEGLGVPGPVWQQVVASSEQRLHVTWSEVTPASLAPGLRVPLRIIHDRADGEIRYQDGVELARLWPGAELVSTTGLGHNRILRDASVAAQVADFLASAAQAG